MKLNELKNYLDSFLAVKKFKTDWFNGLKVKGSSEVSRLGFATNCTFEVIDKAIHAKVDFLFVHHGGWKETDLDLAKRKWDKLKNKNISLYIAHASLDCNREFGTSKVLGGLIGLDNQKGFAFYHGGFAGISGTIKLVSLGVLKNRLKKKLKTKVESFKNNGKNCKKIGIVAGGGGSVRPKFLKEAKKLGCDTYITGSSAMFSTIYAKESKINLLLAGHTATEQPAVKALAKHLGKKFGIKVIQLKEECF